MSDPFTLLHDALFGIVKQSNAVQLAVSNYNKNVISGNEKRLPRQDSVQASDLPEIFMSTAGFDGQVMFSSSTIDMKRSFEFRVSSGDQRPNNRLYPVEFALLCALTDANFGQVLRQLTWYDQRFVVDAELQNVEEGTDYVEDSRGIRGYVALFSVDCRLTLSRQALINFNRGEVVV